MKNTVTAYNPKKRNTLGSYRREYAGVHREYKLINLDAEPYTLQSGIKTHPATLTVRVYWPAIVCYACVWVSHAEHYSIGKGRAGGGGYCKESAAICNALSDAGFQFETCFHGVGDSGIQSAIVAIAEHFELKNWTVSIAHS